MRRMLGAAALIVLGTEALAQSNKDTFPMGATEFACHWGTEKGPGEVFDIRNGSLETRQTGDVWTILQNNQFGLVATQSMSEFVPKSNRKFIGFWSIALDRRTGHAAYSEGTTDSGSPVGMRGTCKQLRESKP